MTTEETGVATYEEYGVTQEEVADFFGGDGNLSEEPQRGLNIPRIRINMGGNDATQGLKAVLPDENGEEQRYVFTELHGYKVAVWQSRGYYAGTYNAAESKPPDCFSEFGIVPHINGINPEKVLLCDTCTKSQWKPRPAGVKATSEHAPDCEAQYNAIFYATKAEEANLGEIPLGMAFLMPLRSYNRVYGYHRPPQNMIREGKKVLGQLGRNEVIVLSTKTIEYGTIDTPQWRQELEILETKVVQTIPDGYTQMYAYVKPLLPSKEKEDEYARIWAARLGVGGGQALQGDVVDGQEALAPPSNPAPQGAPAHKPPW